jgi:hypothetical protein
LAGVPKAVVVLKAGLVPKAGLAPKVGLVLHTQPESSHSTAQPTRQLARLFSFPLLVYTCLEDFSLIKLRSLLRCYILTPLAVSSLLSMWVIPH